MFLAISSFISLMLILGNTLAAFDAFTKLNVSLIAIFSFIFSLIIFFKRLNYTKFSYYHLSILIISLLVYSNYSCVSLGGRDPSIYVSFAGSLANHGTYKNPLHSVLIEKDDKNILFKETNNEEPNYTGMYNDLKDNSVKSDFIISPGILLGECFLFFSRNFSYFINSIISILAIFAFFYFCNEYFDKKTSFLLTLLLCFCPAQIRFGKSSYSEVPSQFFVFSSLLVITYFKKEFRNKEIILNLKSFLLMILTSLFLSSAGLYRPELFVLIFITIFLLPFLKETLTNKERNTLIFFQLFIILFFALIDFLDLRTGEGYINRVSKQEAFYVKHAFVYGFFIFLCSLCFYVRKIRAYLNRTYSKFLNFFNLEVVFCLFALGAVLFLAGGFVYRIMFLGLHRHFWPASGRVIETMNEMIFHRVSVLTGVPFFIASFFGIYIFIKNKIGSFSSYILLFLYAAYASRLFIIQSNAPVLYWAVRRYLPCMVPAIIFFGGIALCDLKLFKKQYNNFIFSMGLYLISILPMLYLSFPMIFHSEMKGALKFTETIEEKYNKNDFVFISEYKNNNILQQLRFLGGYEVFLIPNIVRHGVLNKEKEASLKNLIDNLKKENKEAIFVFIDKRIDRDKFNKTLRFNFQYKKIKETMVSYPNEIETIHPKVVLGTLK